MYARRMPRAAMTVTAVTVVVNFCMSYFLSYVLDFEYAGLAAATAIAFTCSGIYGAYALSRNLNEKLEIFSKNWLFKIVVSLALMVVTLLTFKKHLSYPVSAGIINKSLWIMVVTSFAAGTYILSTIWLKCTEWQWISDAVKEKPGREI